MSGTRPGRTVNRKLERKRSPVRLDGRHISRPPALEFGSSLEPASDGSFSDPRIRDIPTPYIHHNSCNRYSVRESFRDLV